MISVITPLWNQSDLTLRFLHSHYMFYHARPEVEVIVIDNGSTDNTQAVLAKWPEWKGLRVITNETNLGFGPANNQGAQIAKGDILVFLSNDVIVMSDYLTRIKANLRQDTLGGAQLFVHDTGWNKFNGEVMPYMAGWCVCCYRSVFADLGGWDERYVPCDYEDLDLSMTATMNGYDLQEIRLPLQHLSGQSAERLEGGRLAITIKSQTKFREKWGFK